MSPEAATEALLDHARRTAALGEIAGRLGWDQETMMPPGAAGQRAEEIATLEAVLHARRCDPRIGDWLAAAGTPDDPVRAAHLREIARTHRRAIRMPADLAEAIARVTSLSQGEWAAARASEDLAGFLPRLTEVIALKREAGDALADPGQCAYDALLAEYEPGTTTADLDALFAVLRPRLTRLRDKALSVAPAPPLSGHFPPEAQMRLARDLAAAFGYDFARGRIDQAVHPFSSGSGTDVRITTRTDPADPFNCLYSTLHEVGHAAYEQAVDPIYRLSAIGGGASMGVHESQSRLYENQLGRSRAFTGWLFDRLQAVFGPLDGVATADAFHAVVNRVTPGFIRTEADEVHYNLHVLLRYDLEQALISGDLAPADLGAAWNDRFLADFGQAVPRPSLGVLQDVHWSVGAFGYFPTYTLGNVYAGCLFEALRADCPGLDTDLARGDPSAATAWLRQAVQVHGGLRPGAETIEAATGSSPSAEPLLAYLEAKFDPL